MEIPLVDRATNIAQSLLCDHVVLSKHKNALTVLLVGSVPAGFADTFSDVDIWFLVAAHAWPNVSTSLVEAGFRTEGWPNETVIDNLHVHYFALPLSRYEEALEAYDTESLFLIGHSNVVYDAAQQCQTLFSRFMPLSEEFIRTRTDVAWTLVRQRVESLDTLLKRDHPLAWMNHTESVARAALELCCWLDGEAPTGRRWLMEQASRCSAAPHIVPAVRRFIQAVGYALVGSQPALPSVPTLTETGCLLVRACEQALEISERRSS